MNDLKLKFHPEEDNIFDAISLNKDDQIRIQNKMEEAKDKNTVNFLMQSSMTLEEKITACIGSGLTANIHPIEMAQIIISKSPLSAVEKLYETSIIVKGTEESDSDLLVIMITMIFLGKVLQLVEKE